MPISVFVSCVGAVLILGLASVALTRVSEGSSVQHLAQRVFYLAMLAVATTTLLVAAAGHPWWPMCGMTFGVMVVGATLDTQPNLEAEV